MERWESRRVPARARPSPTPEERKMTRGKRSGGRCFALLASRSLHSSDHVLLQECTA
jgi:hypothetical protein